MNQLTPIQQIVGLGRIPKVLAPTERPINNATIGWNAAVMCMQIFQNFSTAPVIAACLMHNNAEAPDVMTDMIGFNPYENLSDLDKKIVEFSITIAELHELEYEVRKGNIYAQSALHQRQQLLNALNKDIEDMNKPAENEGEDTREYPH